MISRLYKGYKTSIKKIDNLSRKLSAEVKKSEELEDGIIEILEREINSFSNRLPIPEQINTYFIEFKKNKKNELDYKVTICSWGWSMLYLSKNEEERKQYDFFKSHWPAKLENKIVDKYQKKFQSRFPFKIDFVKSF